MKMRKALVTLPTIFMILVSTFAFIVSTPIASNGQSQSNSLIPRNVQVWKAEGVLELPQFVDISSDAKYVLAADLYLEGLCLLDETGKTLWKLYLEDTPLKDADLMWACMSDDGKYAAFGGMHSVDETERGFVYFFDRRGHVWNKTDFTRAVTLGSISGDGRRVAIVYSPSYLEKTKVEVYDEAGALRWGYDVVGESHGCSLSMSFNGEYVAFGYYTAGEYEHVGLLHEGSLVWDVALQFHELYPVSISADGKYVIAGDHDLLADTHRVLYFDQAGASLWTQTVYAPADHIIIGVSFNGEHAVAGSEKTIYFFDKTGLKWSYNTSERLDYYGLDISPDGNFIIASAKKLFHFNKYGTLIWEISPQEATGGVAISGNGEYFAVAMGFAGDVYLYSSKKYFNYRFVTPDAEPISNLDAKWYFANGTLYTSMLTNATGWIEFFDPYFLDYSTDAYYWGTKVGSYTLVKKGQYESTIDQVTSLFDWDIYIRDPAGAPLKARVETYLWNGTLYDNRTTEHLRFENMPNQTYTFKVYYPGVPVVEKQIALTKDEQTSTITVQLPALAVTATASPATIYSGGTSTIKISVSSDGPPIPAATVTLTSDKGGSFSTVTDHANGTYTATFTAPTVTTSTACVITATASKSGYISGSGQTTVTVQPLPLAVSVTASPTTIYSGGTSTIKVSVTSVGTAITGATVSLTSDKGGTFSAVADHANGTYTATFTAPDITTQTTCTITASASKSGYTSGSGQAQVTVQPLTLNIYVKDADGKPIAGATVVSTSQPSGQTALSGTTDANGLVVFTGILKGSYTIKASKSGYEDKSWTVTVIAGKATTETVTLSKVAEFPWIWAITAIVAIAIIAGAVFAIIKRKPKL